MSKYIFDSSAILAAIFAEKGADFVHDHVDQGVMSAANYSETIAKMIDRNMSAKEAQGFLAAFAMDVVVFDEEQAIMAASLREQTRKMGFSFADRACLALGKTLKLPILTADKIWGNVSLGVDIRLIR